MCGRVLSLQAVLLRGDVHRVAAYICEPAAVEAETDAFMARFDPKGSGRVPLGQYLEVRREHL